MTDKWREKIEQAGRAAEHQKALETAQKEAEQADKDLRRHQKWSFLVRPVMAKLGIVFPEGEYIVQYDDYVFEITGAVIVVPAVGPKTQEEMRFSLTVERLHPALHREGMADECITSYENFNVNTCHREPTEAEVEQMLLEMYKTLTSLDKRWETNVSRYIQHQDEKLEWKKQQIQEELNKELVKQATEAGNHVQLSLFDVSWLRHFVIGLIRQELNDRGM